jgi:hypothetical protein
VFHGLGLMLRLWINAQMWVDSYRRFEAFPVRPLSFVSLLRPSPDRGPDAGSRVAYMQSAGLAVQRLQLLAVAPVIRFADPQRTLPSGAQADLVTSAKKGRRWARRPRSPYAKQHANMSQTCRTNISRLQAALRGGFVASGPVETKLGDLRCGMASKPNAESHILSYPARSDCPWRLPHLAALAS